MRVHVSISEGLGANLEHQILLLKDGYQGEGRGLEGRENTVVHPSRLYTSSMIRLALERGSSGGFSHRISGEKLEGQCKCYFSK